MFSEIKKEYIVAAGRNIKKMKEDIETMKKEMDNPSCSELAGNLIPSMQNLLNEKQEALNKQKWSNDIESYEMMLKEIESCK